MTRLPLLVFMGAALLGAATTPDLEAVRAEPDLERRAAIALDFAREQVDPLIEAYLEGEQDRAAQVIKEIGEACQLAAESLGATGKHPRKKPKHFKKAEIDTRKLVKRLREAQRELTFEEGEQLEPLISRIEEINSKLLLGIMSRKK